MPQPLLRHPDSRCTAATHIAVDVVRLGAGSLALSYVVTGNIGELRLAAKTAPGRGDELWRRTCFEAFVGTVPGTGYYEFNFAPSTQWAAYRFTSYRSGMRAATEVGAPIIDVDVDSEHYTLQAVLTLDGLEDLPRDAGWRLGLAAITEDTGGRMSYWALAHPPGKADFHHVAGFAHDLVPA